MARDPSTRCRLVLILPPLPDAARVLAEALAGGDVASVIMTQGSMDDASYQTHCEPLLKLAQEAGAAALMACEPRIAARTTADGVFIETPREDARDVVARFSPHKIVGFGGAKERHRALELGEANPEFMFFGKTDGDIRPEPHPKNLALAEWWSHSSKFPASSWEEARLKALWNARPAARNSWRLALPSSLAPTGRGKRFAAPTSYWISMPRIFRLIEVASVAVAMTAALLLAAAAQEKPAATKPAGAQDIARPNLQPKALGGGQVQGFTLQPPGAAPDVSTFDPRADDAYGAFQRGYYLTAFKLALPRAEQGDPAAQTLIAELYDKGLGIPRDPKEAAAWYGIAAGKNYPEAQFAYAIKLLEGKDIDRDAGKARGLMEKAADAGLPTAQFNLAQMIVAEKTGDPGFKKAMPYYLGAAEAGIPDAQYALAQMYAGGLGVEKDDGEARRWLVEASQAGFDSAQVELGIWLANGRGGPADEKAAHAWIAQAASAGNVVAQNRLARVFAVGIGVARDDVEAVRWHTLAKAAGLEDKWLDDHVDGLDPLVVEAGRERAKQAGAKR